MGEKKKLGKKLGGKKKIGGKKKLGENESFGGTFHLCEQTDRQTNRQTDRQTNKHLETNCVVKTSRSARLRRAERQK